MRPARYQAFAGRMYNLKAELGISARAGVLRMAISSVDRLKTLYQVSLALSSNLELDQLLQAVMDQVIAVTRAERGFLMLGPSAEELEFRMARGMDRQTIRAPEFEVSRGVVGRVARTVKPVLADDAQAEGWLAERTSVHNLNLRSIMCVPLLAQGKFLGLVYVDNRLAAGIFRPDDLALLEAIASSAGVAIENARLHALAVAQARLERELEVARDLQRALIPIKPPDFEGLEIAGQWHAAREVAGDFYDFLLRPDGSLGVLIGDVTDKGIPAAFFMGLARTTLRASLASAAGLDACINRANRLICADASGGMFVTLCALEFAPGGRKATCISAGHNPGLKLSGADQSIERLPGGGFPLGIDPDYVYSGAKLALSDGDWLVMYTDGVLDALNPQGEFFGMERFVAALLAARNQSVEGALASVHASIEKFAAGTPQYDDLTLLALRCV
jgi:sigma-B regulation protein RsbU (phosphoserine phosphatase)